MSKLPLVSIVIPVYNGANYVEDAIKSALNQTYKKIEVIVINDGSIDNTEEICKKFGKKIRYFAKPNGGVSSALNFAIDKIKGDYFSWLSHDDLYLIEKIEYQVREQIKLKGAKNILFANYVCINWAGEDYTDPITFDHIDFAQKPEFALLRGCINGITLLIPTDAFRYCGKFNESLKCTQDYDMWWRMLKKGYIFVHRQKILTKTRIHPNQDTQKNPNVISEGNGLWLKMIKEVSDDRKIILNGSLYNYYYEMAVFLIETPYKEAYEFCVDKCLNIDRNKYLQLPIKNEKNKTKKLIFYIKNQGIINTLKIIFKKMKQKNN